MLFLVVIVDISQKRHFMKGQETGGIGAAIWRKSNGITLRKNIDEFRLTVYWEEKCFRAKNSKGDREKWKLSKGDFSMMAAVLKTTLPTKCKVQMLKGTCFTHLSLLAILRNSRTVMAFFCMLYWVKRPDCPVTSCWMGAGITRSSISS